MKKLLLILFFLTGCGPSSVEDCRREANGVMRSLVATLQDVQNQEDLREKGPKIEKDSEALVSLMIRIKKLQEKGGEVKESDNRMMSDRLLQEMQRIYQIDGARELMESYQREALLTLDADHQSKKK